MKFSSPTLAASVTVLLLPSTATAQGSYRTFGDFFPNGDVPLVNDVLNDGGTDPAPSPTPGGGGSGDVEYGLQPSCNTVDSSGYHMCLDLVSVRGTFQSWMRAFGEAEAKWETVITGDLQPISSASLPTGDGFTCTGYPNVIDDLYICGADANIDGPGRVLGSAAPLFARTQGPTNPFTGDPFVTTLTGRMQFDIADIENLELEGRFLETIKHEMGHVIGLGSLWESNGVYNDGTGVYRQGTAAQEEWNAIGCSGRLPVELDGGPGTANGHWDETCLQDEIMTGFISGVQQPFSRITVGSLQDLGYTVNFAAADPFGTNDLGFCGNACPGVRKLQEGEAEAPPKRRKLSEDGYAEAKAYAFKEMSAMKANLDQVGELDESIAYVGGDHMSVIFMESDEVHIVPITWSEVEHMRE